VGNVQLDFKPPFRYNPRPMNAYLFDLDGTITDTDVIWIDALADTLAALGHPVPTSWTQEIVYGKAWSACYARIVERFPDLAAIPCDALAHRSDDFFKARVAATDVRIPGTIALIRRLHAAGAPCAVVSGSTPSQIEDALALAGVRDCFAAIVGSGDYAQGKPSPEGYLLGARLLGAAPADCTVFEDSAAGVAAGKAAGMRVIALRLPDHPPQDLSAADLVLDDLSRFVP